MSKHITRRRIICFLIGHHFRPDVYLLYKAPHYGIDRQRCNTCGRWGEIIEQEAS